jgi:hypothetical protein
MISLRIEDEGKMGTMKIVVDVSAMQVETLTITILAKEGTSMAPKLVTEKALPAGSKTAAKKAAPAKASVKKALPAKTAAAKKAAAAPKAGKIGPSGSRLPAATIRALKELEASELNRYADADDLFRKSGIELGKD